MKFITFYIPIPGEENMAIPFFGSYDKGGELAIIGTISRPVSKERAIQEALTEARACENDFYGGFHHDELNEWSRGHYCDLVANYWLEDFCAA